MSFIARLFQGEFDYAHAFAAARQSLRTTQTGVRRHRRRVRRPKAQAHG